MTNVAIHACDLTNVCDALEFQLELHGRDVLLGGATRLTLTFSGTSKSSVKDNSINSNSNSNMILIFGWHYLSNDSGFQRVRLKQNLNCKGCNSRVHRESPRNLE